MTELKVTDADRAYLEWLNRAEPKGWRKFIDVQIPYRWNIRRLNPGRVLEVGAGVGRHLAHFASGSVGVEMNRAALQALRSKLLRAFHPEEFHSSVEAQPEAFDSLLFSHVAEHMTVEEFTRCVESYLRYIKKGGQLIVICPQEKGYATDRTHVQFMDHDTIWTAVATLGLIEERRYSFPFPRWAGRLFTHNEFVSTFRRAH